jgi:mersacidin/lichenicidin family type 2 lantibiotic
VITTSIADTIRAWKDPQFRASLGQAEQAQLAPHPAGLIELDDAALSFVAGGLPPENSGVSTCTVDAGACCCSGDICWGTSGICM